VGADLSAAANFENPGMPLAAAVWTGTADTQLTRIEPPEPELAAVLLVHATTCTIGIRLKLEAPPPPPPIIVIVKALKLTEMYCNNDNSVLDY
jgi:hypothetical protein